jgi:ADP-ribosyltransferase exoenzyme
MLRNKMSKNRTRPKSNIHNSSVAKFLEVFSLLKFFRLVCITFIFTVTTSCFQQAQETTDTQQTSANRLTLPDGESIDLKTYVAPATIHAVAIKKISTSSSRERINERYNNLRVVPPVPQLKNMNEAELKSLLFYTFDGYSDLTHALLKTKTDYLVWKEPILCLFSALNKLPATGVKTLYHGKKTPLVEVSVRWKVGGVYQPKGFLSTSENIAVAQDFAFDNLQKTQNTIPVVLTLQAQSGRSLIGISRFKTEREILFLPYVSFKITKVEKKIGVASPDKTKISDVLMVYAQEIK